MILPILDDLHDWMRRQPLLDSAVTPLRVLLAIGFIPPGLTKVLGHPFTLAGPETPIGYFFDAFFQSGEYYAFVGGAQILAGLLLLNRRTALIGALIYLPIIANIFVITLSMGFQGTWVVSGLMLLATLYLLCWDLDRLLGLFGDAGPALEWRGDGARPSGRVTAAASAVLTLGLLGFFLGTRGLAPRVLVLLSLATVAVSLPFAVGAWWARLRGRPRRWA